MPAATSSLVPHPPALPPQPGSGRLHRAAAAAATASRHAPGAARDPPPTPSAGHRRRSGRGRDPLCSGRAARGQPEFEGSTICTAVGGKGTQDSTRPQVPCRFQLPVQSTASFLPVSLKRRSSNGIAVTPATLTSDWLSTATPSYPTEPTSLLLRCT